MNEKCTKMNKNGRHEREVYENEQVTGDMNEKCTKMNKWRAT